MAVNESNQAAMNVSERVQARPASQDARLALEATLADTRCMALRADLQAGMDWQAARQAVLALAHDINQPLATLSVLCEAASRMLKADGLGQADRAARLEAVLRRLAGETERAGALVRQLLQAVREPDPAVEPVPSRRALGHDAGPDAARPPPLSSVG
jgi:C4-dicarboxylate-specific signal transduction histidine kinase